MPNLNLKGDAPKAAAGKPQAPAGEKKTIAGLPSVVFYALVGVVALAAIVVVLNQAGIIRLWGKKPAKAVVTQLPQEPIDTAQALTPKDTLAIVEFKDRAAAQKADAKPSSIKPSTPARQTPTAKPTPAATTSKLPTIAVSAKGGYTVQVSSWSSEQKAKIEAEVLKRAGFPAFVERVSIGSEGRHYRVYIGRFDSDKAARQNGEKMVHMLESGFTVVRLPK